jgi:hypothetical protein
MIVPDWAAVDTLSLVAQKMNLRRMSAWFEPKRVVRYEIDGGEFGSVKAHALGGVEHFAFSWGADRSTAQLACVRGIPEPRTLGKYLTRQALMR